ncbi:MAG: hypothetical protein HQK99_00995 [Nitrospirae bacterium]|nr:hypothetical protein [Nitrospirota bacterium]
MRSISEFFGTFASGLFKPLGRTITHYFIYAILVLPVILLTPAAYAGLPHTFSSGTTAKSSEINDNFAYVNYGNIVVKDGNGNELGTFLGMSGGMTMVLNSNGYLFEIMMDPSNTPGSIKPNNIYFSSTNCSGTAYIYGSFIGGTILSDGGGHLYYASKNASLTTISYKSYYYYGCSSSSGTITALPALPNDSSVTGVSSSSFTLPLTVGRR